MIRSLGHVALGVSDIERSLEFYRDFIGMEVLMDLNAADERMGKVIGVPGARCRIVHLRLGEAVLELFHYERPEGTDAAVRLRQYDRGLIHVGFEVDDFHRHVDELRKRNTRFLGEPVEFRPGVWIVYFYGPDGEVCEFRQVPKAAVSTTNPSVDPARVLRLPPPTQLCIVVRDLRQAAAHYEKSLGIGPFVFPHISYERVTYRGSPSSGYWEMAFARLGAFELELACPVRSPSLYEDFLAEKGEGLHHIGFDVKDLDATIEQARLLGIGVLMSGRTAQGGFAHLDTRGTGGVIMEVIQRKGPRV